MTADKKGYVSQIPYPKKNFLFIRHGNILESRDPVILMIPTSGLRLTKNSNEFGRLGTYLILIANISKSTELNIEVFQWIQNNLVNSGLAITPTKVVYNS